MTVETVLAERGGDLLLDAVLAGVRVFDLGRPLRIGMPQSPNHPPFWHTLPRRHGDSYRADGMSAANDLISMGTHVGTHIDALAHVAVDDRLHGGGDAKQAQTGGRFDSGAIDQLPPLVGRAVLLDVPAALGVATLEPAYEITPADLDRAVERQGTPVRPGDVVLIRSGWGSRYDDRDAYIGHHTGVPGVGEAGAQWIAAQRARLAGADTIAFERLSAGAGHALLPAHRVLLVEHGINLIEAMALEELAAAEVHEFTLILAHLAIVGATGSPVRPLAVVGA
ncbi:MULTISPECIES: cyclase family protein [Micromonospora]|uniref:Kynurenine formamidase n=1 Tax=Micromonospora yangpuensis TaxID=683228 RepID=A0A1C6UPH4_9ACTN|nr:cyclase family protein [Micromonospora yangpuensis]GGM08647.1 cyclase [Micromonospora yangpuensis]SCL55823.1 Kynurenine formamidase [Micromonospora yangpuensis]